MGNVATDEVRELMERLPKPLLHTYLFLQRADGYEYMERIVNFPHTIPEGWKQAKRVWFEGRPVGELIEPPMLSNMAYYGNDHGEPVGPI
jgi:hypothetical protein